MIGENSTFKEKRFYLVRRYLLQNEEPKNIPIAAGFLVLTETFTWPLLLQMELKEEFVNLRHT